MAIVQGELAKGNYQVVVISLADGATRPLQSTLATNMPGLIFESQWMAFHLDWSPDGRLIVWPKLVDGRMQLVLIDVASDTIVKRLPTEGFATDPRFSPDGRWIAYASENSAHARGIRIISVDGKDDRPVTKPVEFVKGEFVQFPGGGGLQIPAFLFRPQSGGTVKKPAIVWLHGGGVMGATLDVFDPAIQYFTGNGFIILAPNCRPSRGFSPKLAAATGKDIADDVAAAAAYLKGLDDVDPARIVVLGASFGGYAVLRTITAHPSDFAAAADLSGACDLSGLYRDVPELRPSLTLMLGGSPEAQADRYREESPLNYAERINVPLLIIHGTADNTVPYRQSQLLMKALEKAGKQYKLVTYDGIGHGFPPPVWANAMQQCLAFFARELNLQATANPQ
jgi:dipeptidyl aminopeptidase/acylaminoacyl peptidase